MAEPHVVTALKSKHAELAGQTELTEQRLRELWAALEHVDATLRLFAPDAGADQAQRVPPRWLIESNVANMCAWRWPCCAGLTASR